MRQSALREEGTCLRCEAEEKGMTID